MKLSRGVLIALAASLVPFALVSVGCGCGGADFKAHETEAAIYVSDANTGEPITMPTFKEHGEELPSTCQADPDNAELCISEMIVLDPGVHEIRIEAKGYKTEVVTVDTTRMASVHLAVELEAGE